ncbi:aldehyde dehydrogenase family protein [Psychrobacter sp.]|uniref:aldehyde dehydrogenase family protein n=1 Tax=Psychrobacter sp. TaxID=56811 RepID=UPI0025CF5CF3|nr:aldehyde dehydrogenase family protein [Psychrobacter sp.]
MSNNNQTLNTPTPYENFDLQYIDGKWIEGKDDRVNKDTNPFNGQTIVEIQQATNEQLDEAFKSASEAQKQWAKTLPAQRTAVLHKVIQLMDARRDEIIDWIIKESGSTRIKAEIELTIARAVTVEAATYPNRVHGEIRPCNTPGKQNYVFRDPIGVIALISPWNFPFHLTQRSLAPAIALGNAVVLKPASDTPVTGALLLAKLFEEAGLPKGVLNVVIGAGSEIGDAIVTHNTPSLVSFTGSTPVGKHIGELAFSGDYIKDVALELGGNNPFVVLKDADIDQAVKAAVFGKFLHQGQICMAINRIIVEEDIYDTFIEKFKAKVETLKIGDPSDKDTLIGPIINKNQLESLQDKIALAKKEGANVVLEGSIDGQLVSPYIFTDVTPQMDLFQNEIFGPLVGIIKAKDEEDALSLANDTQFGLSSAVFTGDMQRGMNFAKRMEAGMTHINDMPVNDESMVAFGGVKNSGIGRFNSDKVLEEFTRTHWVSFQSEPREYGL